MKGRRSGAVETWRSGEIGGIVIVLVIGSIYRGKRFRCAWQMGQMRHIRQMRQCGR